MLLEVKKLLSDIDIQPRKYQHRVISRTLEHFLHDDLSSVLIESPTGSGKTIMSLSICKYLQDVCGMSIGWTAMSRTLLRQAEEENKNRGFNLDIDFFSTFSKTPPKNDVLVVDEAQHDSTDSCAFIHNTVKPKKILGLTATPFRSDRLKLCFDKVVKDAGIRRLMEEGYLSKYELYTLPLWTTANVVETYIKWRKKWGKSVLFFSTVNECFEAYRLMKRAKVKCEVVTANSDREKQIEVFQNTNDMPLINCRILTEGFDCPELQTVFVPSGSKLVTIQRCGRVLRIHPDIKFKNIVQPADSKWPFIKTACPVMQYVLKDERWMALKPKTDEILAASKNSARAIAKLDVSLPSVFKKKQREKRGFFGR